jgi:ferritin-like metal-binding protein YciE
MLNNRHVGLTLFCRLAPMLGPRNWIDPGSTERGAAAQSLHGAPHDRTGGSEDCPNGKEIEMVALNNLNDLLIDQLKDLYNAESQLTKALPKMVKAAKNPELRKAFETHLAQTEEHVSRLEQVFESLGEKVKSKTCLAMKGLIEEGAEAIKEDAEPSVKDAALIAAAQRVEHYEIAAYGTVRRYAEQLGKKEAANLLDKTLQEEGDTDKLLTKIAESHVNKMAQAGE